MDLACVLSACGMLRVGGAELHGDHLTTVSVSSEFDGTPHLLVVGGGWVPLDVDLEPLVVSGDAVPVLDLTSAVAYSKNSCTRVAMAYSGYRAAASSSVQLFGLAFGFGAGLTCAGALRFFAPRQRRAMGCPLWGGAPWGCCTGAWPSANTGCSRVAGTSGLDVGTVSFSWNTCLVMRPSTSSASRGPGEKPVPGACPVAAHVGRVAGGVACPRWGVFRGEGALWRPLRPVEGIVQRFPGGFWGVGDAGGELQAVPSAWWGGTSSSGVCALPV